MSLFLSITQWLILYLLILLSVAFFSLLERKILGVIHYRKGPNKIFLGGLTQPFSDAMKLVSKDDFSPVWSNKMIYYLSPTLMLVISSFCWLIMPSFWEGSNWMYSMLIIYFLLSLTVYSVMLSGWSSNSKYSMIGAMRAISQSISYEVIFSFVIISIVIFFSSFSISKAFNLIFPPILALFPITGIFLFSILAELNRTPFDLAEGESELVSGYSVEYGGIMYTIIFLSENMFVIFSSFFFSLIFFKPSSMIFTSISSLTVMFTFCVIRSIMPRLRYDQLMGFGWTKILPMIILFSNLIFIIQSI